MTWRWAAKVRRISPRGPLLTRRPGAACSSAGKFTLASAGVEVGFNADISVSAGLGVTLGRSRNDSFGEAAFGPNRCQVERGGRRRNGRRWRLVLRCPRRRGGCGDRIRANTKNLAAEKQARDAFKTPAKTLAAAGGSTNRSVGALFGPDAQPKPPDQVRAPLKAAGLLLAGIPDAAPAPRPPQADKRASSFVRRCSPSDGGPAPSSARGCFTAPRRSNPRPGKASRPSLRIRPPRLGGASGARRRARTAQTARNKNSTRLRVQDRTDASRRHAGFAKGI